MRDPLLLILGFLLAASTGPSLQAQELERHWWHVEGFIRSMEVDPVGERLCLGGNNLRTGRPVPHGARVDLTTAEAPMGGDHPNEALTCVVADGAGGWYVGGFFTGVGGVERRGLARIQANGLLHPWHPVMDGEVNSMLAANGNLYVGGNFTQVNSQPRGGLAAFDLVTGELQPWAPSTDHTANLVGSDGPMIHLSGWFTEVNGSPRNGLAAVDGTTGALLGWAPEVNYGVSRVLRHGNITYIAGNFTQLFGNPRPYLAGVHPTFGTPVGNALPIPDATVNDIALSGDTLLVCGYFSQVDGLPRQGTARIDLSTGDLLGPWVTVTNTSSAVERMLPVGDEVILAGGFSMLNGVQRSVIGKVHRSTGAVNAWAPNPTGVVDVMSISDGALYVGGRFTTLNTGPLNRLVALDLNTGAPGVQLPEVGTGSIRALLTHGDVLYIGGAGSIAGEPRHGLAAVDLQTNMPLPFAPVVNGELHSMVAVGDTLYLGGAFTAVNGQPRQHLAAMHRLTGSLFDWAPVMVGVPNALMVADGMLYVVGTFTSVNGELREHACAFHLADGSVSTWAPVPNGPVPHIIPSSNGPILGGSFSTMNGEAAMGLAAVDGVNGQQVQWTGQSGELCSGLHGMGEIAAVSTGADPHLAFMDLATGAPAAAPVFTEGRVSHMRSRGTTLFTAGILRAMDGHARIGLAVLDMNMVVALPEMSAASTTPLHVWPNPATTGFWVRKGTDVPVPYELLGSDGRLLRTGTFMRSVEHMERQGAEPGVYILRTLQGDGPQVARVVFQ